MRALGRGLASLTNARSVSASFDGAYTREAWAERLLGPLDPFLRPTRAELRPDARGQDMEILLCQTFLCAYRLKLQNTGEGDLPRLRQLRMSIEAEQKTRAALLAHMELSEWRR